MHRFLDRCHIPTSPIVSGLQLRNNPIVVGIKRGNKLSTARFASSSDKTDDANNEAIFNNWGTFVTWANWSIFLKNFQLVLAICKRDKIIIMLCNSRLYHKGNRIKIIDFYVVDFVPFCKYALTEFAKYFQTQYKFRLYLCQKRLCGTLLHR
jgi:hypothetical protein